MVRRLRIMLMWLLAAALPVQGMAAATMVACGPMHHHVMHAQVHPGEHHQHASIADEHPHHGTDTRGGIHELDKASCSACASCCAGVALPATVFEFDGAAPVSFFAPAPPDTAAVFMTGGPERPPRPSLA